MADAMTQWCAEQMNKLPEVRWDRCTRRPSGETIAYGWIDRDDGKADFIILYLGERFGFVTSSAKHSRSIGERLLGSRGEGHRDCERIEEVFGDLVKNKVMLRPPSGSPTPREPLLDEHDYARRMPDRRDIEDLAMTDVGVHEALTRHHRGEITYEQALSLAVLMLHRSAKAMRLDLQRQLAEERRKAG